MLDRHINSDSMKRSREAIYEASGTFLKNKEIAKAHKRKRLIMTFTFLFISIVIAICIMWKYDYIMSMITGLELELVDNKTEIGISKLNDFKYTELIKNYSSSSEIILPEVKIETIGEYNLKYTVMNQSKKLSKSIVLIVYDDLPPSLILKQDSLSLDYGSTFNAHDYIKECIDNVDGDLTNKVEAEGTVRTSSPGDYKVVYHVKDSNNNETEKTMVVTVKQKEQVKESPTQKNNSSSGSSDKKTSSSSKRTVSAKNKTFYFEEYGTSDATQTAALNYGNSMLAAHKANGFSCIPVKSEGIYVGFQIIFD